MSARYERGSIVLTSNKSFAEWGEVLGDTVLATAILDRLLHHSHVVNIRGESYQLREKKRAGLFGLSQAAMQGSAATERDHWAGWASSRTAILGQMHTGVDAHSPAVTPAMHRTGRSAPARPVSFRAQRGIYPWPPADSSALRPQNDTERTWGRFRDASSACAVAVLSRCNRPGLRWRSLTGHALSSQLTYTKIPPPQSLESITRLPA